MSDTQERVAALEAELTACHAANTALSQRLAKIVHAFELVETSLRVMQDTLLAHDGKAFACLLKGTTAFVTGFNAREKLTREDSQ
jgi:hypothetical protein